MGGDGPSEKELRDGLSFWVDVWKRSNGYADLFQSVDDESKRIVELSTVREFGKSFAEEFGGTVTDVSLPENDPPDCVATIDGVRRGIELVQFVDQDLKKRAAKGESPYQGQLSQDAQWTKDRFYKHLLSLLEKKSKRYNARGVKVDILLVHSDEPWLLPTDVGRWLSEFSFPRFREFSSVFFLMTYDPMLGQSHWPQFRIHGGIGGPGSFDAAAGR